MRKGRRERRSVRSGNGKIYKQLITTLEGMEVKPIEAVGQPFDPNFHNAVMHVEDEDSVRILLPKNFRKVTCTVIRL